MIIESLHAASCIIVDLKTQHSTSAAHRTTNNKACQQQHKVYSQQQQYKHMRTASTNTPYIAKQCDAGREISAVMQQGRSQHLYTQAADRRLQFVIQKSQVANRNSEPRFFPEEDERHVLQCTVRPCVSCLKG